MKLKPLIPLVSFILLLHCAPGSTCTDIIVGRLASIDGSVITSHTGCCSECRVHYVPAQTFPKGALAPVYLGLQNVKKPLRQYGEVIGRIPQVE